MPPCHTKGPLAVGKRWYEERKADEQPIVVLAEANRDLWFSLGCRVQRDDQARKMSVATQRLKPWMLSANPNPSRL